MLPVTHIYQWAFNLFLTRWSEGFGYLFTFKKRWQVKMSIFYRYLQGRESRERPDETQIFFIVKIYENFN